MKVGDYVGQVIRGWTYPPALSDQKTWRKIGPEPVPVGIVVGIEENRHPSKGVLDRKMLVLGDEGQVKKFAECRLEVINGCG